MLNKVMLIGRLGADPEVRYTATGDAITNVRLATGTRWKDKQTGEQREKTEWHRVVFYNIGNYKIAEIAGQYLKKGSQVYIEGRIQTNKWQDKATGQDRYTTEIVAEQLHMLGSKEGGTASFGDNSQEGYVEPQAAQHYQQPAQQYAPVPPVQQYAPAPQPAQHYNQAVPQPAPQFAPPPVQQPFNPAPPPQFNQQPVQQPFNPQVPPPPQFRQPPAAPAYSDDYDDDVPF